MQNFIAIDFETGNAKRVSACAIGLAQVSEGSIVDSGGFFMKPVGGHAPFQSKIHGIMDQHTRNEPDFSQLYPTIKALFKYPLVAHSMFDKQVLDALFLHFKIEAEYTYLDTCSLAKETVPNLINYKLKTLAKHFGLPKFKHHDAMEDAVTCAKIYMKLQECGCGGGGVEDIDYDNIATLKDFASKILEDNIIDYKEAYELLYWLEDHPIVAKEKALLYNKTKEFLADGLLEAKEAIELKELLIRSV